MSHFQKVSDKYYAGFRFGRVTVTYHEVRAVPVVIPGYAHIDLYASRGYNVIACKMSPLRGKDWYIYDGITGLAVTGPWDTIELAEQKFIEGVNYHRITDANWISEWDKAEQNGTISPRYKVTEPE